MSSFLPTIHAQNKARTYLERFYRSGKIPHALRFVGPPSVGKMTTARQWAKLLLCADSDLASLEACGQCSSCHSFESGTHPDLITLAPAPGKKAIGVDEVRELILAARLYPLISSRKLFLLDEADSMGASAQNSLLKILEEAPENQFIILICRQEETLLPTVLSRTVRLPFDALRQDDLAALLPSGQEDYLSLYEWQSFQGREEEAALCQQVWQQVSLLGRLSEAEEVWSTISKRDRDFFVLLCDFLLPRYQQATITTTDEQRKELLRRFGVTLEWRRALEENANVVLSFYNWLLRMSESSQLKDTR